MTNILKNSTISIKSKNRPITTGAIPLEAVTIASTYRGGQCVPLFIYLDTDLKWLELRFAGIEKYPHFFKPGDKITIEIDIKE